MSRQHINSAIEQVAALHSAVFNPDDHTPVEALMAKLESTLRTALLPTEPWPDNGLYDGTDRRLECWYCPGVQSVALAPRQSAADAVDVPAHWVPVCERHADQWGNETDAADRLPVIPRYGVALSKAQAQVVERWSTTLVEDAERARVEDPEAVDWTDADDDALEAIETGLRALRDIADPNEPTGDQP